MYVLTAKRIGSNAGISEHYWKLVHLCDQCNLSVCTFGPEALITRFLSLGFSHFAFKLIFCLKSHRRYKLTAFWWPGSNFNPFCTMWWKTWQRHLRDWKRLAVENWIRGAAKKFHEQLKKQSTSLYYNFSIFKYLITIVVECVSYNLTQEQSDFFFL